MADVTAAAGIYNPAGQVGYEDVKLAADAVIVPGQAVTLISTGYADDAGDDVNTMFAGVAEPAGGAKVDNTGGSAGDKSVRVRTTGTARFLATSPDISWLGKKVYFLDNQTVGLAVSSTNRVLAGRVVAFGTADVQVALMSALAPSTGRGTIVLAFPVTLAQITGAGDVVTNITPGFSGVIKKVFAVVNKVVTTAAKLATLNVEIGTTDMTGGTLALTSANCTPLGVVVAQGAAPTAGNRFDDDDTLSIEAASVTAFAEGEITVYLVVELDN